MFLRISIRGVLIVRWWVAAVDAVVCHLWSVDLPCVGDSILSSTEHGRYTDVHLRIDDANNSVRDPRIWGFEILYTKVWTCTDSRSKVYRNVTCNFQVCHLGVVQYNLCHCYSLCLLIIQQYIVKYWRAAYAVAVEWYRWRMGGVTADEIVEIHTPLLNINWATNSFYLTVQHRYAASAPWNSRKR